MTGGTDWADQARRLLETLSAGMAGAAEAVTGAAAGQQRPHPDDPHPAGCRWCLHCQVGAVLRGERPEISAALADVLATTAAALHAFAAGADAPTPPPDRGPASAAAEEEPPPDVQRIEIA